MSVKHRQKRRMGFRRFLILVMLPAALVPFLAMHHYLLLMKNTRTLKAEELHQQQQERWRQTTSVTSAGHQQQVPRLTEPAFLGNNKCNETELETIRYQLPEDDCQRTSQRPWVNKCSFSYATRCPDSIWYTEQYYRRSQIVRLPDAEKSSQTIAIIYVGCNKAMDAVNSLRMISGNETYNLNHWKDRLYDGMRVEAGRCGQDEANTPYDIGNNNNSNNNVINNDAIVYCIEAMPVTAARLSETATELGWQNHLIVSNAALADSDGTVLFPNVPDTVGVENQGIENCQGSVNRQHCKEVPLYRLDTFVQRHNNLHENVQIDFLSIDVEGYDYDVILGAPETLKRTKYVELEYNWKGNWPQYNLSTVVDNMKDAGFVCYWAGTFGHIWRITDCFLPFYNLRHWSNVACVNVKLNPIVAARMEELFHETLAAGQTIRYHDATTANTGNATASA